MRGRPCRLSVTMSVRPYFGRRDGSPRIAFSRGFASRTRTFFRKLGFAALPAGIVVLLFLANSANAQVESEQPARVLITQGINEGQLATLQGNTRPEANAGNDQGAVADYLPMEHMLHRQV